MTGTSSFLQSHSYMGQEKGLLPSLVLASLLSLSVASIIGVALSGVVFGPMNDLKRQGRGIAQCFVLFSSLLSLLYVVLHLLAAQKGESLYLNFDPPIPSFKHQLHAWAIISIRLAVLMWSTSCIAVAVGIHHGGGGHKTARLDVDIFACAVGFVFGFVILCVVQMASRPFDMPWTSSSDLDKGVLGTGDVEEKSSRTSDSSSNNSRTIRVAIGHRPNMPSKSSSSNMSGSTSSSQSKTRRLYRTRRYVLEAPSPIPIPVRPPKLVPSDEAQTRSSQHFEETLVPRASQSESYFTAAVLGLAVQQDGKVRINQHPRVHQRSGSAATAIYMGSDGIGDCNPRPPPPVAVVNGPREYPGPGSYTTTRLQKLPSLVVSGSQVKQQPASINPQFLLSPPPPPPPPLPSVPAPTPIAD
ncbi:hypothetical protein QBC38DRAFT_16044 [Podospora fimiseda]|uniref:Uncharacterized protein n=1 Tax=Podospora fimiseda TaxID=252190 RepID=A0AAN7BJI9_9PEZI|nr:hypothetical protein QBC38DRAFT_16044 [Podospora fimiseda]